MKIQKQTIAGISTEFITVLKGYNADEQIKEIARRRDKALRDEASALGYARRLNYV